MAGISAVGGGRRVLLWDAPNMDMCLSEVIGQRASAGTRPDMGAVAAWLARRCGEDEQPEAAVFANVARGYETAMAGWVASLRHLGWAVFVKPKQHRRDDVDADIVHFIERRLTQGRLVELLVASHDAKAFAEPLERAARGGVHAAVVGFRERAAFAAESEVVDFIDLEDIPGAFREPLPRTNLFDLPPLGRWFAPFIELNADVQVEVETSSVVRVAPPEVSLERSDVIGFLLEALRDATRRGAAGLSIQAAGDLLRDHFADFSLEAAGFVSYTDLVEELVGDGEVGVVREEPDGSWLLVALPPVIDLTAATPVGPRLLEAVASSEDDGATSSTEPTAADDTEVTEPSTAGPMTPGPGTGPNPIYRAFGYRPPGAGVA